MAIDQCGSRSDMIAGRLLESPRWYKQQDPERLSVQGYNQDLAVRAIANRLLDLRRILANFTWESKLPTSTPRRRSSRRTEQPSSMISASSLPAPMPGLPRIVSDAVIENVDRTRTTDQSDVTRYRHGRASKAYKGYLRLPEHRRPREHHALR